MGSGLKRLSAAMLAAALACVGLSFSPAMAQSAAFRAEWLSKCTATAAAYRSAVEARNPEANSIPAQVAIFDRQWNGDVGLSGLSRNALEAARAKAEEVAASADESAISHAFAQMHLCGYPIADRLLREKESARQAQQLAEQQRLAQAEPREETDVSDTSPSPTPAKPEKKKVKAQPAHHCVDVEPSDNSYGQFINICEFDVQIAFCNLGSPKGSWAEQFACEAGKGAGPYGGIRANGTTGAHVNGATYTYWFACRDGYPTGLRYETGRGLVGRCG